jgi:hypothetical protein
MPGGHKRQSPLPAMPSKPRERFRWEAEMRTTSTVVREDLNGLGSFTKLNPWDVAKISLVDIVIGGEFGIHHEVPFGAKAIFVRRRVMSVQAGHIGGWTIMGHEYGEGDGRKPEYYFFDDGSDSVFKSDNFNAI